MPGMSGDNAQARKVARNFVEMYWLTVLAVEWSNCWSAVKQHRSVELRAGFVNRINQPIIRIETRRWVQFHHAGIQIPHRASDEIDGIVSTGIDADAE